MNSLNEWKEMKEQLALLNNKLEKESIVNERLMRTIMKDKARSLRKKAIIEAIITIIGIPYFLWVVPELLGLSLYLCVFVAIMMALALVYNYIIHSNFHPDSFMSDNLVKARQDTLRMKKLYANWTKYIGIPFAITFFCWFIYEIMHIMHGAALQSALWGMCVGLAIGLPFGIYQYRRVQRTADEILQQIEDLTAL